MRILALAVLAAIIVVSGIWLARDRSAPAPTPEQTSVTQATAPEAAAADDSAPADPVAAQGEPAPADPGAAEPGAAQPDTTEPGADEPDATAPDAEETDDAEEPDATGADAADVLTLPEGFTAVEFLSDVPQQAFDAPEQVLEEGLDYVAVIRTNRGDITVDLYEERTPVTVNNFVFLALHRYYEGVPFHRVIDGFMAQTGDPTGTGTGGPGYQFDDEIVEGLAFDSEGILAMANAGKAPDGSGTNGSQFFITFGPATWLTGAHTIFGHVVEGLDLLPAITRVDPAQPNAVVAYSSTVGELAEQGVDLPAEADATVAEAIEELLGALPSPGQSFSIAGYRGVAGQAGTQPAFGFFRNPDVIESVVIATRPE